MSITQYTVGSVKTFRGHDGHGWSCFLLKDKKKVAEVVDDAWGGGLQFHWLDIKTKAVVHSRTYEDKPHQFNGTVEEAAFYADILTLPKMAAQDDLPEMFIDPDIFVGDLVNAVLTAKEIAKDLKKKVTIQCVDGRLLTWKVSKTHDFDALKAHAQKKHPDSVLMNDLPIEKVIAIYKDAHLI